MKKEDEETWRGKLLASDWGADQGRPVLRGANLGGANLQGAGLEDANLQGAVLLRVNLQGAVLEEVNLQEAVLINANLQGANLRGANLQGVRYEPDLGGLPDIVALRTARHLETLRFSESPHGLEELKQAFKDKGMRQQEREIIHAIKRSEQEKAWEKGKFLDSLFNWVFSICRWATGSIQGER